MSRCLGGIVVSQEQSAACLGCNAADNAAVFGRKFPTSIARIEATGSQENFMTMHYWKDTLGEFVSFTTASWLHLPYP